MTTTDHSGHRQRLCERIRKYGLDSLYEHEILEYLLFPFLPRRNTNDIAHNLLTTFGSLAGVFDAQYDALMRVDGVTDRMALFLCNMPVLCGVYNGAKHRRAGMFRSPGAAAQYICDHIGHLPTECFLALCLDAKGNLLQRVQVESDSANSVQVNVRKLLSELVHTRAVNVVVGHNHPSGDTQPSPEDNALLDYLRRLLAEVDIHLVDCIVVAGDRYCSMMARQKAKRAATIGTRDCSAEGAGRRMPAVTPIARVQMAASVNEDLPTPTRPQADLAAEVDEIDLLHNPTPRDRD